MAHPDPARLLAALAKTIGPSILYLAARAVVDLFVVQGVGRGADQLRARHQRRRLVRRLRERRANRAHKQEGRAQPLHAGGVDSVRGRSSPSGSG